MSLIIKDKIPMFIKGYPTVSDKYNVSGGILTGSTPVKFGELVKRSDTAGYFEAIATTVALADIVGFALATNVKLAEEWPARTIQINPGEAFNLLINGFIAIELDADATIANVAAVAAKGAASTDSEVDAKKTYYTRALSDAGAGYLNDGTYAYTAVASPTGNPSTSDYYELSVLGSDAVAAVPAVGAASTDTEVDAEKTYYTRALSDAGAGLLNDGTYAYTAVASPTGNPSTSDYYELSVLGSNAVAAVAAVGTASEDIEVYTGKTYYTRALSSAGAGYLNDGTYAYTVVASPTGNPSTSSYYELSVLGSNAITDKVIANSPVYVILANGHLTTEDKASEGAVVQLPGCVFTGIKEIQGTAKLAEIYVK